MGSSQLSRRVHQELPHYLFLFPLISGLVWFTTISILLIYWIAIGRPRFPYQNNPYVAFISNIAAFHLKPLFVTGSAITSITFVGTIFSVNYARNSSRFYGGGSRENSWRKLVVVLILFFGLVAAISLFCLSLFDTYRVHQTHKVLLLCVFGSLGLTALGTGLIWGDVWIGWKRVHWGNQVKSNATKWLSTWCAINSGFMVLIFLLGIAFITFMNLRWWRVSGTLEWIVTFTGCLWLLTFAGLLYRMKDDDQVGKERFKGRDDEEEDEEEQANAPDIQAQTEPEPISIPEPESQPKPQPQKPNSSSKQPARKSVDWERAPLLTER